MSILRVSGVSKIYGRGGAEVKALVDITLSIERGEFVAIMGASGSGKSTLLYLLGGLDSPSSGSVAVDGQDFSSGRDGDITKLRRRRIGFIFQSFNLVPVLTVLENVALPLVIDGIRTKEADRRAMETLALVGMTNRRDHFPETLSGGEQQRTAIARALVIEPAIVLADEPTGNLDTTNSAEVMRLLRRAREERGQTIVMVTHDQQDAAFADRVVFLKDGLVVDEAASGLRRTGK